MWESDDGVGARGLCFNRLARGSQAGESLLYVLELND